MEKLEKFIDKTFKPLLFATIIVACFAIYLAFKTLFFHQ